MTDVEARLRDAMRTALDPVVAEKGRRHAAIRSARVGRVVRGISAGLACVLVAGAAALALEPNAGDDPPRPASPPEEVMTFALDFRTQTGDGTLTVDVPKGQVCLKVSRNLAGARGQLHYTDPTVDLIVEYVTAAWRPVCHPFDQDDAARIVEQPERHYLTIGPRLYDARASLEPLIQPPLFPDDAEIVCSQDGAIAITPQVLAQDDGVHVRFYASGGRWTAFNLLADDGKNEGGRLRQGSFVTGFAPGPLYAGCFEHLDDASMSPRDPAYTTITIVDPQRLWTPDELDCDAPEKRRAIDTGEPLVEPERFDELIREHVPGIEPTDDLERPRYPQTEFHFEPRTVVRDGRRIAGLLLVRGDVNWAIDVQACEGSGIAE